MISRSEVLRRALSVRGAESVEYDQGAIAPDGWRADCSGYVSLCWGIPPSERGGWGGQSTVTLVSGGYIREITINELLPGDAVGVCGPDTGGDFGHIVLFRGWLNYDPNDDRYHASEHRGGRWGPEHRVITYPYDGMRGDWRAWRYTEITDEDSVRAPGTRPA